MKLIYSRVDFEILRYLEQDRPVLNRDLVKIGISLATEAYVYQRLRGMEGRGLITRTSGPGRSRMVSITEAGRQALALMTADARGAIT